MLSDLLFETIEKAREWRRELPDVYAPHSDEIDRMLIATPSRDGERDAGLNAASDLDRIAGKLDGFAECAERADMFALRTDAARLRWLAEGHRAAALQLR